jgi:tetratricopeptide (TPR) repeat protein
MWRGVDYLLVGSEGAATIDPARLAARLQPEAVGADLARVHLRQPAAIVSRFVAATNTLRLFAGDGPLHTDDNGWLEYAAPRTLHRRQSDGNIAALARYFDPPAALLSADGGETAALAVAMEDRRRARLMILEGDEMLRAGRTEEGMELWGGALESTPEERDVLDAFTSHHFGESRAALTQGDLNGALRGVVRILRVEPHNLPALKVAGRILATSGHAEEAIPLLERALALAPDADTQARLEEIRKRP